MYTLLSATPSPYARKVRIALLEKRIPFTLRTEVPWDKGASAGDVNPLGKIPVLLLDDGQAVYDSRTILEFLELNHPVPALVPAESSVKERIAARQIESLCDGICDALVLYFFEGQRDTPSEAWRERQGRKIRGGLRALCEVVDTKKGEWILGGFGVADICVGAAVGYVRLRGKEFGVDEEDGYEVLRRFSARCEERGSFVESVPLPQNFQGRVV